jgi:16S rRNA (guanine1516-N2)-methyltransferase
MDDPALGERLADRFEIINADAREVLHGGSISPDAIYIDPMFPPKRKASALAKKEIRMVRRIVGDDEDASELLAVARRHAPRVVVKRPTAAPPLADKPAMSIAGKLVRYDVYLAPRPNP